MFPDVTYSATDDSITVDTKDAKGFSVSFGVGPRDIIVSSDYWHEHFEIDEADKALDCFGFMLSDSCRLKIEYRGRKAVRWTIESFEDGNWIAYSTTGLFNLNFWSPTRTKYFQNNLITTGKE